MPWGFAAAAVGTVAAGAMSSSAANSAANAQQDSAQASIAEQQREFNQTQANQAPFLQNGTAANKQLATLLGINSGDQYTNAYNDYLNNFRQTNPNVSLAWTPLESDVRTYMANNPQKYGDNSTNPQFGSLLKPFSSQDLANDPVYNSGLQFGLNQGTGAINQRALQSGGYDSGATLKALTQYANDYGSTKANDSYNRDNTDQSNVFNRLSGIAGTGQQAVNQVQTAGTNEANQVSNSLSDAGNARSAGIIGGANAWGGVSSGLNSTYQNYNSNQLLQQLLNKNTGNAYQTNNAAGYAENGTDNYMNS